MRIAIINGPNLNLLGKREVDIYGNKSFDSYFEELKTSFPGHELSYFQSNVEGELIDAIQKAQENKDAVVLNAGGYTHTSVSIRDAIAAVKIPVIEVHISNPFARDDFRKENPIDVVVLMHDDTRFDPLKTSTQNFPGGRV